MEVARVLCMNGGSGDTSYATNSLLQIDVDTPSTCDIASVLKSVSVSKEANQVMGKNITKFYQQQRYLVARVSAYLRNSYKSGMQKVISLTKTIFEEAVANFYCSKLPATLAIADLGCSSGPNTLYMVSEVIKLVEKLSKKLNRKSPEYQVYLNDLPGNDFNNIFRSLESFKNELRKELSSGFGSCYFNGVPGSFYGRLFCPNSIHMFHSSYSLMWLSQVPEGIENNKGNIYMASTSPPNVLQAYYGQFQKDFSFFLKCRAEELVEGGQMVLTFLGRKSEERSSKECCYIWELMARALYNMVQEGIIEEEKLDSFNIPQYAPSPSELKLEVLKEGSFTVNYLNVSELNWDAYDGESTVQEACYDGAYNVAKCMRAVAEPLLISHFGDSIIDQVFSRYRTIVADCMSKEETTFVNVTVSLTKNA